MESRTFRQILELGNGVHELRATEYARFAPAPANCSEVSFNGVNRNVRGLYPRIVIWGNRSCGDASLRCGLG